MDLGLNNKHAMVTGASQGIGRAIAVSLAKEGAKLHLVSRSESDLIQLSGELKASYGVEATTYACDLTQPKAAQNLIAACPELDILINNAGNTPRGTLLNLSEEDWRPGWELKIFGYINLTREVYR